MLNRCIISIVLLWIGSSWMLLLAQHDRRMQQQQRVDSIVHAIRENPLLDIDIKTELLDTAYAISRRLADTCRLADILIMQSTRLDELGMSDSALTVLYWASDAVHRRCDSMMVMRLYGNLSYVYLSLGEHKHLDSVSRIALDFWNPRWEEKGLRFTILNNMAVVRFYENDTLGATTMFHQVLTEAKQSDDVRHIQEALSNLGTIKGIIGDLDSAYYFINAAAVYAKQNQDVDNLMDLLINMANLHGERGEYGQAEKYLDSAFHIATTRENKLVIAAVHNARADLFALRNRYQDAYHFLREYIQSREAYLDEERVKSVNEMMEKYQSEKKARQIQKLELDKLDADLRNARITSSRNRFLFGGIFVFLISIGLWSRLRYVRKSRTAIQKEKDISEGLLLNILPESVAGELKRKGYAEARHYDMATVLFSDFRGFTSLSESMSAADLVSELNVCFKAFDEIMTKYRIEKIKTIGDAYMSAGGIPDTNSASAADVVHAGLEMQQFVVARQAEMKARDLPSFEMRIGIHSGPVVAGIVGLKKFQYDIWGDAVNTASRMESSGEVGRVNISEDTFQLVKDDPQFRFTSRGKISAKGKGELEMYFVDAAAP